jgi:predicted regulator of Ras-like GTPase activity (Roadblock/LC7/MglB family)
MYEELLRALAAVPGVVGSFVASERGVLLVHAMPPEFPLGELERTAALLGSIRQNADARGVAFEQCQVSVGEYTLIARRFGAALFCTMTEQAASSERILSAMRQALEQLPGSEPESSRPGDSGVELQGDGGDGTPGIPGSRDDDES